MSASRFASCAVSVLLTLLAAAPLALADEIARGDAAYLRRAEGGRDGRAAPEPIREAIRAYQGAIESDPQDLEAHWKLLRALHFEGEFATDDRAAKRRIFDRARTLSERGIELLAERVGGGQRLHELSEGELQARLARASVPTRDVAALHFWSAINWAAWSQVSGLFDAVRRGVANRIHEDALLVLAIAPDYEDGRAHRLLAALHARLPRVPLVSGWVDRARALPHAESALAIAPQHPGNQLLLALTLLDLEPERRSEAVALLEKVAASEPRAATQVEDLAIRREARERLALERARDGEGP